MSVLKDIDNKVLGISSALIYNVMEKCHERTKSQLFTAADNDDNNES